MVVLNIGQSRLRVTDQADESCGKMAQPVSREVGGNRRWQGGSSHALGTVTVNQVHNISPGPGLEDGGNALVISEPKLSSRLSEAQSNAATGYYRFKSGNGH